MKTLALLALLLLAASPARPADPDIGPILEVSSFSGSIEMDMPSALAVALTNNATAPEEGAMFDASRSDALGIVAELLSSDERVLVFSSPQVAGSLAPGEGRELQFTLRAEGAQPGLYPLQLRLRFSRLSRTVTSGDQSLPDVVFSYENIALELPLEARVVQGPKIVLQEQKSVAVPGKETQLQILLANHGGLPAEGLQIRAWSSPPFLRVENPAENWRIEPGGSVAAEIRVLTDDGATPGYYALPCQIIYGEGAKRRLDLSLVVSVQREEFLGGLILPVVGALLLALLLAGGILWARGHLQGRRGRKRL